MPICWTTLDDLTLYPSPQCASASLATFSPLQTPSFFPLWGLGLKRSSPLFFTVTDVTCNVICCNPLHSAYYYPFVLIICSMYFLFFCPFYLVLLSWAWFWKIKILIKILSHISFLLNTIAMLTENK